jgi:NADPH2:quinone reductase
MKAWLLHDFTALQSLQISDVPDPVAGHNEVVIDVEYAALNPADRYLALGQYPAKPPLPHVMGRDGVGIISAVGPGVTDYRIGDRAVVIRGDPGVHRWGTLAQRVAVPLDSISRPPAGWTIPESGCAALVYLTAWQALTQWGDLPPTIVLVTGASGGVGVASIQLARALGHRVIALSRGAAKHQKLMELGAQIVLDSRDDHWPKDLLRQLAGERVGLAIETIGGPGFVRVIESLGLFAKVSAVGQLAGPVPNFNIASLFFRRIRVGGVALSTYKPGEALAAWTEVVKVMQRAGVKPVIDRVFQFSDLPAAFDRLAEGPIGKVLVEIRKPAPDSLR